MNHHFDHELAGRRLEIAIEQAGFSFSPTANAPELPDLASWASSPIPSTKWIEGYRNLFGPDVTAWIRRLLEPSCLPDWHVIEIDPSQSELSEIASDFRTVAQSETDALAQILDWLQFGQYRVLSAFRGAGAIKLYGVDGLMATIKPISFQQRQADELSQAVNQFKGLSLFGSFSDYTKKLTTLPGLSRIAPPVNELDFDPSLIEPAHPSLKNLVTGLLHLLRATLQPEPKRCDAQEILAKTLGLDSWHHLIDRANSRQEAIEAPCMVTKHTDTDYDYNDVVYCRGLPSAFFEFGRKVNRLGLSQYSLERGRNLRGYTIPNVIDSFEVAVRQCDQVIVSQEYRERAQAILSQPDFMAELECWHYCYRTRHKRTLELNKLSSELPADYLYHKGWMYFVSREGYGSFTAEATDAGEWVRARKHTSTLIKTTLVDDDGAFWLADDWDLKPKFRLPELDRRGAEALGRNFGIKIVSE